MELESHQPLDSLEQLGLDAKMDRLSLLPKELKDQIMENMFCKDIITMRLMSRAWALLGAENFFRDGFTIRPHLDDMTRLEGASQHPVISKTIRSIAIFMGDMEPEHLLDAIDRKVIKKDQRKAHDIADRMFHSQLFSRHCSKPLLCEILPRLPNLSSLTATSAQYPFAGCGVDLLWAWRMMIDPEYSIHEYEEMTYHDSDTAKERYHAILESSQNLASPLHKLVLDRLPVDCLVKLLKPEWLLEGGIDSEDAEDEDWEMELDPSRMALLGNLFSKVRELHFGIFGLRDEYENTELARALGDVFGKAHKLTTLILDWEIADSQTGSFNEAWQKQFVRHTWPQLEILRLRKTEIADELLLSFLKRHASTLKYLDLTDMAVDIQSEAGRTYKDFLTELRDNLKKLEKFQLVIDEEADLPIYDKDWLPVRRLSSVSFNFEETLHTPMRVKDGQLLEWYVLGKSEWPMREDDPDFETEFGLWTRLPVDVIKAGLKDREAIGDVDLEGLVEDEWEDESDHGHRALGMIGALPPRQIMEEMLGELVDMDEWEDDEDDEDDEDMPDLIDGDLDAMHISGGEDDDEMPELIPID
jgi:hypothetical protein